MNSNDSIKNLNEKNEQQKAFLVESVDENNMFYEMLKKYSDKDLEIPLNVTKQGMKLAKNKFKDKIINNSNFNSTAALNAIKNLTEKNEQQKASLVESVDENILTK